MVWLGEGGFPPPSFNPLQACLDLLGPVKQARWCRMTTNDSGKLNRGGVSAIKSITQIPGAASAASQSQRLDACLTALAHQPSRWYKYQDWGKGGPVAFLAARGIEFTPVPNPRPVGQSWYGGCGCGAPHWRIRDGLQ